MECNEAMWEAIKDIAFWFALAAMLVGCTWAQCRGGSK